MNATAKKSVAKKSVEKTVHKPLKSMTPRSQDIGYGPEPTWTTQPAEMERISAMTRMFNWYNYHYGKKEAKDCIVDWLVRNDRTQMPKHLIEYLRLLFIK